MSEEKLEESAVEPIAEEKKPAGFAHFAQRAAATYFDLIVFFSIYFLLELVFIKPTFKTTLVASVMGFFPNNSYSAKVISALILVLLVLYVISFLINGILEAGKDSVGLGKKLLGIYVVDEHLKKINLVKSLLRNFSKILSLSVLGFGFVLYFLNDKKQTLHDIISNAVVVRKSAVDANKITVVLAICVLLSIGFCFCLGLILPAPNNSALVPKRAVDVIAAAKGFVQTADTLVNLTDSLVIYDPLREVIEVYASEHRLAPEQIQNLTEVFSESVPDFIAFKANIKLKSESIKCSSDSILETSYQVSGASIDVSENIPEINEIRCELINESHFFAKFFRKKTDTLDEKNWEVQISSKLRIRREKAKLSFDSEDSEASVAIWQKDGQKNLIEIAFFPAKLNSQDLNIIRQQKAFTNYSPNLIVTFELQPDSQDLNVATVIKYGISFLRSKKINFPGKQERVDFFYVPAITENLQLAKLGGRLAEGERITGYLNHQARKVIAEVEFEVDWNIVFNLPLIDLAQEQVVSVTENTAKVFNLGSEHCNITADQSEMAGVDSVALYYPEEGDIAVGIFSESLTQEEKEQFRKKKSIWSNLNGKQANFVVFFDLKRESSSFSRERLIEYSVFFIRDNYARLYFPGSSDRAQFSFKDIEFTAEDINGLTGNLAEGSEISFNINKKKESKLSGLKFSWDCYLKTTILKIQ